MSLECIKYNEFVCHREDLLECYVCKNIMNYYCVCYLQQSVLEAYRINYFDSKQSLIVAKLESLDMQKAFI